MNQQEVKKLLRKRGGFCLLKHFHPSRSEADYCDWLLARKQSGEIKSFIWQRILDIGGGKRWQIDFEVLEKDGSLSYHESKGWNRSDQMALFKLSMSLNNFPNRVIYWNKKLVPALDSAGRLRLKNFSRSLSERKEWVKKINKQRGSL